MPAKFVLTESGKRFHWDLHAANGKVIATSEHYETRRAALAGIESVRKNAAGARLVEEDATPPQTEVEEVMQNLSRKRPDTKSRA